MKKYLLVTLAALHICSISTVHAENSAPPHPARPHVAFVAGKASHLYGEHEFNAGGKIVVDALNNSGVVSATLYKNGWPDQGFDKKPDAIVFYMDGLAKHEALAQLKSIQDKVDKGVGIMAMHFAVHLPVGDGSKAFSQWIGGYYETGFSTNPHWRADININKSHAVLNGVEPFQILDELYFNIRFADNAPQFTKLLSSTPPSSAREHIPHGVRKFSIFGGEALSHIVADEGKEETLAWSIQRKDGGRGLGFTGGHFHWNWANDNYRKFVLNAISWTAGATIPKQGINSQAPDIDTLWNNQDESPIPFINNKEAVKETFGINEQALFIPESMFSLPENLKIELWAASPQLYNPTNIDIDKEGRIWVTEGWNYRGMPNPRQEGDRIVVLTDSNGDGIANNSHTFVQDPELIVPMGIAVVGNKIYVSQPPHLIVYTDTNNNLVFEPNIDKRENLLTGFLGRDHDHSLHSVTVGPDGWLYANTGNMGGNVIDKSGNTYYFGSTYNNIENAGKTSADGHVYIGGSAFRFPTNGEALEVIGHNFRNSYEQSINSLGDIFQSDNDDYKGSRTSWLMEYGNMGYASDDGKHNWSEFRRPEQSAELAHWRQADPGIQPAGDIYGDGAPAGIVTYESTVLGEEYLGAVLSAETALNAIIAYKPQRSGGGYSLNDKKTLITSNPNKNYSGIDGDILNLKIGSALKGAMPTIIRFFDPILSEKNTEYLLSLFSNSRATPQMFRPSDIAIGLDGSLYIADWFDPRTGGHTTLDNKRQGAIYRISTKNQQTSKPTPKIDTGSIDGAIEALKSPAVNVRGMGFHALKNFAGSAQPAVEQLLNDNNPYIRARAIWLLPQLSSEGVAMVKDLLKSPDETNVITALRSLKRNDNLDNASLMQLSQHPAPSVRREIALKLRDQSWQESQSILVTLANNLADDRWSIEALGIAASGKEHELYQALLKSWPQDARQWDKKASAIAWRLHPYSALEQLKQRALAENLSLQQRKQALDALAFITTKDRASKQTLIKTIAEINLQNKTKAFSDYTQWWASNIKDLRNDKLNTIKGNKLELKLAFSKTGDRTRGETILGNSPCLACHSYQGQGGDTAPSLERISEKLNRKQMITNIIQPISAVMPSAAKIGLSEQDVADLASFLKK